MRLAADRDGIAREYATSYATTFEIGVPALLKARADALVLNDAIVETFLHPDTGLRSLRAWVDEGWIAAGRGSGDWRSYTDDRITHQMSIAETARHL